MTTTNAVHLLSGGKLYQQRAREALPLLVRQANATSRIFYSDLATELGMPNPRNLNYVLGNIGEALKALSQEWGEEVPPIQCLVVNKHTGIPGEGIGWFITDKVEFRKLPLKQQRRLVEAELQKVFSYSKWPGVLQKFGLKSAPPMPLTVINKAAKYKAAGESKHHKKLKDFVAKHPQAIRLPLGTSNGETEYALPSGDTVDVLFVRGADWIGVEVKSKISPEADIARGIFQCIKYRAVIEAYQASQGLPQNARALLVLESKLPPALVALKNTLGVEVLDEVSIT